MACLWYTRRRVGGEWIPTKVQVTQDVDDEGRKIFEAFYGMPLWHNTTKNYQLMSTLDRVFGVTNDDDARTNAEFSVDELNKKKKQENQPPLQFLKVVGAVRIPRLFNETYYLMTLQVVDGSTEPRKLFAKVIQYDCRHCQTKHVKLDEWLRVDDDLTQLKHPLFKIMLLVFGVVMMSWLNFLLLVAVHLYCQRREEKWFLKEVEAEFEQKKSLFLSKISPALGVLHAKGEKQILEVVSSDLQKLAQFKEPDELEFEEELSFVLLQEEDEGCESSPCQAMQHVVVDGSKVNSSIPGPSSSSNRDKRFGFTYENLSAEEKACWPNYFSGIGNQCKIIRTLARSVPVLFIRCVNPYSERRPSMSYLGSN
ncbi:hypothetical protein RHMOL_Rhmol10G0001500 [Rhododendron molle]|uniref:Uncharacterized protein n=1 Tax=Rhododendron molle TaxID=49168 RepID=A0ACC0LY97_RHOML|nr:hypothetical protein RHMOL_Rhmol10G0001500 [Rhododendron molle]